MRITSTPGVTVTMTEPEALKLIQEMYQWIGRAQTDPPNAARPVTIRFSINMSDHSPSNGWVSVGP